MSSEFVPVNFIMDENEIEIALIQTHNDQNSIDKSKKSINICIVFMFAIIIFLFCYSIFSLIFSIFIPYYNLKLAKKHYQHAIFKKLNYFVIIPVFCLHFFGMLFCVIFFSLFFLKIGELLLDRALLFATECIILWIISVFVGFKYTTLFHSNF